MTDTCKTNVSKFVWKPSLLFNFHHLYFNFYSLKKLFSLGKRWPSCSQLTCLKHGCFERFCSPFWVQNIFRNTCIQNKKLFLKFSAQNKLLKLRCACACVCVCVCRGAFLFSFSQLVTLAAISGKPISTVTCSIL